jgi:hypothetical protein
MPAKRHHAQPCAFWIALLLLAASCRALLAQSTYPPPAHATLRDWEEQARLAIFDRSGSYFGRTSDRGILQRFNETMDFEYHIDLVSYGFSLSDVYDWYRHTGGARFWAGSIDHRRLIQQADLSASVALGAAWAVDLFLTHQQTLEVQRNLLRLRFRRRLFDGRAHAFLLGTLKADKPEADIEVGFTWFLGPGELTLAFAALDLFSDFIYKTLEIGPPVADTALDYTAHPYTARLALDISLGRQFRAEAYALAMTPTTVRAESQTVRDEGFTQDERYAYAGGLLEWSPSSRTALGGFGNRVRARLGRSRLPLGRPEDDFDLTERTSQLGLYGIHRFSGRFSTEAWLARVWRSEDRVRPDTSAAPNVDYADRAWAGRTLLTYRARNGFRGDLSLDFLTREIVERDDVPGVGGLDRDNFRLRFGLGWQFEAGAQFMLGASIDLDDSRGRGFDGAYGRFVLYW